MFRYFVYTFTKKDKHKKVLTTHCKGVSVWYNYTMKQKMFKKDGFSLVEFILIMIIVAVITTLSVGLLKSPSDTALILATKKVAYDISYARERAMVASKEHKVYINTPDRLRIGYKNYTLIYNPDDLQPFDINISSKYGGVSFFNNYSIKFDSFGRNAYKNVTSVVLTASGKQKVIGILPNSGRVYVK